MNTQSIFHNTHQKIINSIDELFIEEAFKLKLKDDYGLYSNSSDSDIKKLFWIKQLFCKEYCGNKQFYKKLMEQANTLILRNKKIYI